MFSDSATLHNGPIDFVNEQGEGSWGETQRMCGAPQISPGVPPAIRDFFYFAQLFFCSRPVITGR